MRFWQFVYYYFEGWWIICIYFQVMKLNIYKVIQLWIFIYIWYCYVWTYAQQQLKWIRICLIHQTLSKSVSEQNYRIILYPIQDKILFYASSKTVLFIHFFLTKYLSKFKKSFWISINLYIPNLKGSNSFKVGSKSWILISTKLFYYEHLYIYDIPQHWPVIE